MSRYKSAIGDIPDEWLDYPDLPDPDFGKQWEPPGFIERLLKELEDRITRSPSGGPPAISAEEGHEP